MNVPDFYVDDGEIIDSPDNWDGGRVWHTGGGIFCRSWERKTSDGRKIEVIYNHTDPRVGINHYPDVDDHGVDDSVSIEAPKHTDEQLSQTAEGIMLTLNMILDD